MVAPGKPQRETAGSLTGKSLSEPLMRRPTDSALSIGGRLVMDGAGPRGDLIPYHRRGHDLTHHVVRLACTNYEG